MIITRRMSPLVQAMLAMGIVGAAPAVAEVAPVIRERQPPPPPIAVDLPKPLVVPPRSELPTGTLPPRPPPPPLPVVRADPAAKARRKAEKKARRKNRR